MSNPVLTEIEIITIIDDYVDGLSLTGRHVVVVVPDGTRTVPMPLLAGVIDRALRRGGADRVDYLVALGTHQPMSSEELTAHLGPVADRATNHAWWDPDTFVSVGTVSAEFMADISDGRMGEARPRHRSRADRSARPC